MEKASSDRGIVVAFLCIITAFCVATAVTNVLASRIDASSDMLAFDSAPSIAHLAAARGEVRQLEFRTYQYMRAALNSTAAVHDGIVPSRENVDEGLRAVDAEIDSYLRLPLFPGERSDWQSLRSAESQLDAAVERAVLQADLGLTRESQQKLEASVHAAAERTLDALATAIAFHAEHARDLALEIKRTRHNVAVAGAALDALAIALGAGTALLLRRSMRRQAELAAAHTRDLEERTRELDIFAGRVAHDVMSPIGAAALAFDMIRRRTPDQRLKDLAARGLGSIQRSRTLVDDLLEFTRAGAKAHPNARSDLGGVVDGMLAELGPLARQEGIALEIEPLPPSACRCSNGVLMSLLYNLVRNSIKYMGDAPVRRIAVRATACDGTVRVEVADTGPGLAPELAGCIFEPFVRAHGSTRPGIGLGLATVKRLAEGHGGRVGLRSEPGQGATFWFELPSASEEVSNQIEVTTRPRDGEPREHGAKLPERLERNEAAPVQCHPGPLPHGRL